MPTAPTMAFGKTTNIDIWIACSANTPKFIRINSGSRITCRKEARSGERAGAGGTMNITTPIAATASAATRRNMPLMPIDTYSKGEITSEAA